MQGYKSIFIQFKSYFKEDKLLGVDTRDISLFISRGHNIIAFIICHVLSSWLNVPVFILYNVISYILKYKYMDSFIFWIKRLKTYLNFIWNILFSRISILSVLVGNIHYDRETDRNRKVVDDTDGHGDERSIQPDSPYHYTKKGTYITTDTHSGNTVGGEVTGVDLVDALMNAAPDIKRHADLQNNRVAAFIASEGFRPESVSSQTEKFVPVYDIPIKVPGGGYVPVGITKSDWSKITDSVSGPFNFTVTGNSVTTPNSGLINQNIVNNPELAVQLMTNSPSFSYLNPDSQTRTPYNVESYLEPIRWNSSALNERDPNTLNTQTVSDGAGPSVHYPGDGGSFL